MTEPDLPPAEWLLKIRTLKHEMSNVLMGLLGHAELLEDDPDLPETSKERVQLIRAQLHRLQDQIGKLNSLSR